ncbi:MAG TPA: GIY-YIG nuclease family protein [Candidatus Portnoybacteria bacterium]|nr:GIY-YIG nuclease family protein [Candidatus Portnoybacteria bacterium]
MKTYCVYIITNQRNTVLYTGVTGDLQNRIWQHKNKIVKGFTKKYNVDKLVYYETFSNPTDAIAADKKIKGWNRKKKIDLIKKNNLEFKDLSI